MAARAEIAGEPFVGVKAHATAVEEAERLWKLSIELIES